MTSTESIVQLWREDLLNPANTHSEEEAEPEDFGLDSPITGAEVTGAVQHLHSSSSPGLDEIRPELLEAERAFGVAEGVFQQLVDHTPQPPREDLVQGPAAG